MRIKGKNVLITGAAGGIGKALAMEFAVRGANLFLSDINESGLQKLCIQIEAIERQCYFKQTDITQKDQVKEMTDDAIRRMGHVDILINNAGVTVIGEIKDVSLDD